MSAGLAIYDTMQYIRSPVSTVCIGQAASMGSLLLTAGAKGKRFALPNCPGHGAPAVRRRAGPGDRHRDPGARDPDAAQAAERDLCPATRASRSRRSSASWSATPICRPRRARDFGLVDEVVESRPDRRGRRRRPEPDASRASASVAGVDGRPAWCLSPDVASAVLAAALAMSRMFRHLVTAWRFLSLPR